MIDLDRLEELAGAFTPIPDCAVILGVSEFEFLAEMNDESSAVSQTYRKAAALARLRLRQKDIEWANDGAPGSMEAVRQYAKRIETQ